MTFLGLQVRSLLELLYLAYLLSMSTSKRENNVYRHTHFYCLKGPSRGMDFPEGCQLRAMSSSS